MNPRKIPNLIAGLFAFNKGANKYLFKSFSNLNSSKNTNYKVSKPIAIESEKAKLLFEDQMNRLQNYQMVPKDIDTPHFDRRKKSVKVIYDTKAFPNNKLTGNLDPFSLIRTLTKVAVIDVRASQNGVMPFNMTWPGSSYFMNLKPGDINGLSPEERINGRKKAILSDSKIYRFGGYPSGTPVITYEEPVDATVVTIAGPQFESIHLDYNDFIIDPYYHPKKHADILARLNDKEPEIVNRYRTISSELGSFSNLNRDSSTGAIYHSLNIFRNNDILLFDRDAYFHSLVNMFTMIFASAELSAQPGKMNYVKLPLIGMGYFSKIHGVVDIHHILVPIFISALFDTLNKYHFKNLSHIEVPYFDRVSSTLVDLFNLDEEKVIGNVTLNFVDGVDLLNVRYIDQKKYKVIIVNPGDVNAYPGNEFGGGINHPSSVESAVGNHTDIRVTQNYATNPELINPNNWIGMTLLDNDYQLTSSLDNSNVIQKPRSNQDDLVVIPKNNRSLVLLDKMNSKSNLPTLFAVNNEIQAWSKRKIDEAKMEAKKSKLL